MLLRDEFYLFLLIRFNFQNIIYMDEIFEIHVIEFGCIDLYSINRLHSEIGLNNYMYML